MKTAQSDITPVCLFTIGYGSRDLDSFGELLREYQVEFLVDVRSRPYSRFQPFFGREHLQRNLRRWGVRYGFMGDLLGGQPEDQALYTEGRVDYGKVWRTPVFARGIERLIQGFRAGYRIVLMCSEERPENCHRSKMIAPALIADRVPVQHISEAGQLISQRDVMDRLSKSQLNVFGSEAHAQYSRKKYRLDP